MARRITVAGGALACEDSGSGEPVLLLHAGVADSRMWQRVLDRRPPGVRLVRYDLRGFGESTGEPGTFSHVRDAVALLDALDIPAARVVGASFGGLVALLLALEAPSRVTSLLLLAPALDDFDPSPRLEAFGAAEDAAISAGRLDEAVALNVETWAGGLGDDDRALVADMQRRAFELQLAGDFEDEEPETPVAARLDAIRVPTEVLVGDRDLPDFPAIAERIGAEVPGARVEVVPGAGHLIALSHPGLVAERLSG